MLTNKIETLNLEILNCIKEKHIFSQEKEALESEMKSLKIKQSYMDEEISKIDYIPVKQFDNLYWGDNYPALKVLFHYLQKMNAIRVNWSYFANCMCVGNFTPIHLYSYNLGKQDIGYLLATTKEFFNSDINSTPKKYSAIIQRKFKLNDKVIDQKFFDLYIREYKRGLIPKKLRQDEIDNLVFKISEVYL